MKSRNLEDVGNIHIWLDSGLGHLDPQTLRLKKAPEYDKRELHKIAKDKVIFA